MSEIKQKVLTNHVFKQSGKKEQKNVYYVPGYLRMKTKNFTELDLVNLKCCMNATLIFTIYYYGLEEKIVEQLQSKIVFNFSRNDAIQLTKQNNLQVTVKNAKQKSQLQFTLRQIFQLRVQPEVFLTPFEIINLILSITIQPVVIEGQGTVKINLMDNGKRVNKTSYSLEQGTFGTYDLAQKKMASIFTNKGSCNVQDFYLSSDERKKLFNNQLAQIDENEAQLQNEQKINGMIKEKKKENQKVKIKHFQYGHFLIPLYRYPWDSLATIFFPIWLLAIINLGIFFQDSSISDRIISIAGIMIAYVALIPTIRESIPPSRQIVLIEYLVYLNSLKNLFVVIDSIVMRNKGPDYEFVWYQSGLYLVSCIITALSILIVVVLMARHHLQWVKQYKVIDQKEKQGKFKRQEWDNEICEIYFKWINKKFEKNNIKPLSIMPDRLGPLKSKKIL